VTGSRRGGDCCEGGAAKLLGGTRFLLVLALVAAVCTQLPRAVAPQTRAAFAAPAGGDAVTVWNATAGVAATKACIAPLDDRGPS
jgi:hypothetical protein